MNKFCMGHFFAIGYGQDIFYRCLWGGEIIKGSSQGSECPKCNRAIDGKDCGVVESKAVTQVAIPFFDDGRNDPYIKCLIPEDME